MLHFALKAPKVRGVLEARPFIRYIFGHGASGSPTFCAIKAVVDVERIPPPLSILEHVAGFCNMANLMGKLPLGQKQPKPPSKPRKPLARVSEKKRAQKATEAAQGAREHMARVAALPCLVCGYWPVEVHHEGSPRSDLNVLPLCAKHHRREYGPGALHYSRKAFYDMHGPSDILLARVADLLR